MAALTAIGTFIGGLGLLLLSFAVFWFCALYKEANKPVDRADESS